MIHVEDYIGGFLLKNHYCTFPSLGTLNLKKSSSAHNSGELEPPEFKLEFSPIGIIDDAFPTYIADHENVSIAKASNEIRNFSQSVKASLQKSGRYDVDMLGSFILKDNTVIFKQSSDLNLGYEPVKTEPITEPTSLKTDEKESNSNTKHLEYTHADSAVAKPQSSVLIKYLLGLLLLVGIAAGAYFGYNYWQGQQQESNLEEPAAISEDESENIEVDNEGANNEENTANSNEVSDTSSASTGVNELNTAAPAVTGSEVNVAVKSFIDRTLAESKSERLNKFGNKTSVVTIDGKNWLVITASEPNNNMEVLKDSLRKFFNPSGTPFIVK